MCDFFFQAEDGIRDLVRSRGLGDVYKRQKVSASGAITPIVTIVAEHVIVSEKTWKSKISSPLLSLIHI